MNIENVTIGMKVVPHDKTRGAHGLNNSNVWRHAVKHGQPFLYVTDVYLEEGEVCVHLNHSMVSWEGDTFNFSDFDLYTDKQVPKRHTKISELPSGTGFVHEFAGTPYIDPTSPIPKTPDPVNHPPHYTSGGLECWDAIKASMTEEAFRGYLKGNVMKYLWRYEKKVNPSEDLKKAKVYLDKLLEEVV